MAVTTNLNLYMPSDEDYVSNTRDINENYIKIDAAIGKTMTNFITSDSMASLETQLDTIGTAMEIGEIRNISIVLSSTLSPPFDTATSYVGIITKTNGNRYQVKLNKSLANDIVSGTKTSNGWEWEINESVPEKMASATASNNKITINIGNNARISVDFIVNYINSCFSIIAITDSSGNVSVLEKSKGDAVTLSTSAKNKIVANFNVSIGTGTFFIWARTKQILDGITIS